MAGALFGGLTYLKFRWMVPAFFLFPLADPEGCRSLSMTAGTSPGSPRPAEGAGLPRAVVLTLLGLAAATWAGTLANQALDEDESQHLHAAWLVGQGHVPFVDFWEHHLPLLYYLLAPLTRWLAESPGVYFVARGIMAVAGAVTLGVVYRLGRRFSPGAAMAAVILLAFLPRFVEHVIDVRPDGPALLAWVAALLALVTWRERQAPGWLWAAGLALGVAGAFTPKAAYGGLGMAAAVAVAGRWDLPGGPARAAVALARFAAGAGVPFLGLLALVSLHGGVAALDGLVENVLARALDFADFTKERPVSEEGGGFLLLALAGIILIVRRHRRGMVRHPVHGPLLMPLITATAVLLLPRTPAVYQHAWLPVLAIASLYAGLALSAALDRARAGGSRAFGALAMLAVLVGLGGPASVSIVNALRDKNHEQLRIMRLLLRHACPGEPVLDGTALYVFRPAAYRHRVLIGGVRAWIAGGVIPEERIVEDLDRSRPRVAYIDRRLRALIGPVAAFLERHYTSAPDGILVAGATIPVSGGPGRGRAYVELLRAETYRLVASPGIEVAIDRRPTRPGLIRLDQGRHEVRWTGAPGMIRLTALSCPERRQLG